MATEETTITELELAEEVLADMVIPVDTSTDTKSVSLKQLRAWLGSSLPTGFILPAVGGIDDERFSLLDGKTLSKQGTYGAFCAKVEERVQASNWFACTEEEYNADLLAYGQCGKFVIGTDYVRIPTITRFIGATITLSEIGKTYKESLPNITGEIQNNSSSSEDQWSDVALSDVRQKGAFSALGTKISHKGIANSSNAHSNLWGGIAFDASSVSSTYQDGAKVQPDHTKYPYYMVISTEGQTAEVQIDINQVYEDLNLKANSDLSNVASVASSFKEASIGWGMPDYSAGVAIGASGYTVPKNGWICSNIYSDWATSSANGRLLINGIIVSANYHSGGGSGKGHNNYFIVPISKNDVVTYTTNVDNVTFYPCKGVN